MTQSLTIFCSKITNHNNGQHDIDKTCFCLQRNLSDGNESNPKKVTRSFVSPLVKECTFAPLLKTFSSPSLPHTCIQIPYKTQKKPSFCYFSLQIPFFAVIHRFCSWLSSVTQSHHALEHENTYISLTLLPRMSYRARRGTSPCLAAGLNNHGTEAGFHWQ